MEHLAVWLHHYGAVALFCLMALGILGLPIPEETTLVLAGALVYRGHLEPIPAYAAAFLGASCGITLSYGLGRTLGLRLLGRYGRLVRITPERLEKAHAEFERVGRWGLMFGYFLPGIRHLTALAAGTTRLGYSDFALFAYGGALAWSFSFVSLGVFVGRKWLRVSEQIHDNLLIASAAMVGIVLLAAVIHWLAVRRGGRPSGTAA